VKGIIVGNDGVIGRGYVFGNINVGLRTKRRFGFTEGSLYLTLE